LIPPSQANQARSRPSAVLRFCLHPVLVVTHSIIQFLDRILHHQLTRLEGSMHTSTSFHLSTETALLTTLYARSKAQHRSQLFLRHLAEVIRLCRLVAHGLAESTAAAATSASASAPASAAASVSVSTTPTPAVSARSTPAPAPSPIWASRMKSGKLVALVQKVCTVFPPLVWVQMFVQHLQSQARHTRPRPFSFLV